MTHRHPTNLLEAYVDGELSAEESATVQDTIAHCPECRSAVEQLQNLKRILKQGNVPDPGPEYWHEVESLIHAKTIDRFAVEPEPVISPKTKQAFTRAVASFAAAIALFAVAITMNQYGRENPHFADVDNHPVFVVAPMQDILPSFPDSVFTEDDQFQWARAIVYLGFPGSPGRMIGLQELPRKPI